MKNTKNTAALAMAIALLILSASSCGNDAASSPASTTAQNNSEPTVTEAEETTETHIECSVPQDLSLGGQKVRMLIYDQKDTFTISVEEVNGELLNDAVYNSNQKVMDDLDCVFEYIDNGGIESNNVKKAFRAGDDIYDIVFGTTWTCSPLVAQHTFANINASQDVYIDYEKPWWYQNFIYETVADNTHTYFLGGDASPDIFRRSSMMILNTDLLADIGGNVGDVYQTILDGNWTYDVLSSMVASVYIDNNGDSVRGDEDTFGFVSWTRSDVEHFMIDCGIRGCSRDENGVPYLSFNNEKTQKFVEAHVNFLWNNPGSYYVEGAPTFDMLQTNRALFLCEKFSRLDLVRDIETNFSLIPIPKLDETIESYGSLAHDDAIIMCIPAISANVTNSTAVLEKMAYYYYYDVMPQYYDVILKNKYSRDSSDDASRILDLIHDSMTTDFGYIYNYALDGMMTSLRDLIGVSKKTDFASTYAKREKTYEKDMAKLLSAIQGED